jgi:pimeloyl-ACP methyl ester carboxylesterase
MGRITLIAIAIFTVATAAFVYAAFLHDLSDARARLAGRSRTIETSFGALEYAVEGAGAPVLSIHGGGGGFDQAIEITGPLAERGYQLVAPSRFGYLGSASPGDLTTAKQADAYVELLDKLGIDKAYVIGVSAGAWSAMQFAIRHPERCRALALLVPAAYAPTGETYVSGGLVQTMLRCMGRAAAAARPAAVSRVEDAEQQDRGEADAESAFVLHKLVKSALRSDCGAPRIGQGVRDRRRAARSGFVVCGFECGDERIDFDRLLQESQGAKALGAHAHRVRCATGDDDRRRIDMQRPYPLQDIEAADAGQIDVQYETDVAVQMRLCEEVFSCSESLSATAIRLQEVAERFPVRLVILDDVNDRGQVFRHQLASSCLSRRLAAMILINPDQVLQAHGPRDSTVG